MHLPLKNYPTHNGHFYNLCLSAKAFLVSHLSSIYLMHMVHLSTAGYCLEKFIFLVGKTSLITRFMYDSFDNTYQVSEAVKVLHINHVFAGASQG